MDEESNESLDYLISCLMVFYKGALSYTDLQSMPIPELYQLNAHAAKINKEIEKEVNK